MHTVHTHTYKYNIHHTPVGNILVERTGVNDSSITYIIISYLKTYYSLFFPNIYFFYFLPIAFEFLTTKLLMKTQRTTGIYSDRYF